MYDYLLPEKKILFNHEKLESFNKINPDTKITPKFFIIIFLLS